MSTEILIGDCRAVMADMPADSIDTIITDPPYGLSFMGQGWDHGVPGPEFWTAALRVAKPGAFLLAFGGTRTFHRLAVAIEDAGWQLRDTIGWIYGSGFPKSHNISKAIDKAAGAKRKTVGKGKGRTGAKSQPNKGSVFSDDNYNWPGTYPITEPALPAAETWHGFGTALKPAWEPIIVAMKPLDGTFAANALNHGVAGFWIDGARVGTEVITTRGGDKFPNLYGTFASAEESQHNGRWPANIIHDGSEEVMEIFPETGASRAAARAGTCPGPTNWGKPRTDGGISKGHDDNGGSAARFFYCAKASAAERSAGLDQRDTVTVGDGRITPIDNPYQRGKTPRTNSHPTVKPLELMRYLCRLTRTPAGGTVLDPFAGSGTTGCAAVMEGRGFIGIEIDPEYAVIARARIKHWQLPLFSQETAR